MRVLPRPALACVTVHFCRAAQEFLLQLVQQHLAETGSTRASRVIDDLEGALSRIWCVVPAAEKSNPVLAKETAPATATVSV